MMNLDQMLGTGSDALRMPKGVGTAFDTALKVGSFVESGIDKYKEAVAEWNELKRFSKRLENYKKDPQVVYYIINSLMRDGKVRLPNADNDPIIEDNAGIVKSALTKLKKFAKIYKGKDPFTINDYVRFATGSGVSDGINTPSIEGANPEYTRNIPDPEIGAKKYTDDEGNSYPLQDAFTKEGYATFKNPSSTDEFTSDHILGKTEIHTSYVKEMPANTALANPSDGESTDSNKKGTYRTITDDSVTPNNQDGREKFNKDAVPAYPGGEMKGRRVDVNYRKLNYPYIGNVKTVDSPKEVIHYLETHHMSFSYKSWGGYELGSDNIWNIRIRQFIGHKSVPKLPTIVYPISISNDRLNLVTRNLGEFCPCISYSLNIGSLGSKPIALTNGSSFSIPTSFQYNMTLSVDIVDDVYKSWYNYMCKYMNCLYDAKHNTALTLTDAAIEIELAIFRPGFLMNYRLRMYAVPTNFNNSLIGESEAQVNTVHVDYSIIGLDYPSNGNDTFFYYPTKSEMNNAIKNAGAITWNQIYPHPA
jgi:hypothetical protein